MFSIMKVYITMLPLILSGIANMIFVKSKFVKDRFLPIDKGYLYKDGKRILGDNKTVLGFFGMVIFYGVFQVIWGICCKYLNIEMYNDIYRFNYNSFEWNSCIGITLGFVYMIGELPNSFIKRRLDIEPGKTEKGLKGKIFFCVDQIDSLILVFLVISLVSDIGITGYFTYLFVGFFTHIILNTLLYLLKIRKNL